MPALTILRIILISLVGTVLYIVLIYGIQLYGGRHLRKRSRSMVKKDTEGIKIRYIIIYFLVLFAAIILIFLSLELSIKTKALMLFI